MQVAFIRKEKCDTTMCSRCVKFCPASKKNMPVIFIGRNKKATVVEDLCTGCGRCVKICPEKAIEMRFVPDPVVEVTPAPGEKPVNQTANTKTEAEKAAEESKQTAPSASAEHAPAQAPAPKRKETPEEKTARLKKEHVLRIIRTAIALVLGIIAGIVSFYLAGTDIFNPAAPPNWIIGILVWLVAVVIQKTIFMLIKIDVSKLGKKDWFYQGFMTFCAWFMTWTMLLSTALLPLKL